ncbi:hypothetical protein [Glutamicibacter protophormiae]|uniref:hypothetical protein n=1 Tax=Glutamicibacter protophormiae TaxID=37930 RepID=UPI003A8EFE4B
MPAFEGRLAGDEFTPTEKQLLDRLCSGLGPESFSARRQLQTARWGGYEYEGCKCFLIQIPASSTAPLINHDGGPFTMLEVSADSESFGMLELWVLDGLLHSVTYMPFGEDHVELPTAAEFELTLIEYP